MGGAVPLLPNTPSWRDAQLVGAQGQFYLLYLPLLQDMKLKILRQGKRILMFFRCPLCIVTFD
jgi:hypothetical protein